MKDFKVVNGDVIVGRTVDMVSDDEHQRQKVELVIGTNKGEWLYDPNEGIDFSVVLCKNPDEHEIRATIEQALVRLDETFVITAFELKVTGRKASVSFTAVNGQGVEVGGDTEYAY